MFFYRQDHFHRCACWCQTAETEDKTSSPQCAETPRCPCEKNWNNTESNDIPSSFSFVPEFWSTLLNLFQYNSIPFWCLITMMEMLLRRCFTGKCEDTVNIHSCMQRSRVTTVLLKLLDNSDETQLSQVLICGRMFEDVSISTMTEIHKTESGVCTVWSLEVKDRRGPIRED